ncbi:MAG: hypothetical protein HQK65_00880 [Desulfamplus sp.]|nr:hypothetical protein [Desulfamplus sp.]
MRPHHLTLLLVLSSTLDYRFFGGVSGIMSFTLAEIASVLVLILSLGMLAKSHSSVLSIGQIFRVARNNSMAFGYMAWITVVAFLTYNRSEIPLQTVKSFLSLFLLYLYIILTTLSDREILSVLRVYLFGAIVQICLGFFQVMLGWPRIVELSTSAYFKMNLYGSLIDVRFIPTGMNAHPNGFAMFLLSPIILLFGLLIEYRVRWAVRAVLAFMLCISLFVLWETQGKTVIVFTIIGMFLIILPRMFDRLRLWITWIVLLVSIFAAIYLSLSQYEGKIFIKTMLSRLGLIEAAIAVFEEYPYVLLVGGGTDQMLTFSHLFSNMQYPSSHNTYIDQVLLFGLPALFLYLGMVVKNVENTEGLTTSSCSSVRPMCRKVSLLSLILLLGVFFFEPALEFKSQMPFFFLCGLLTAMRHMENSASGGGC